MANNHLFVNGSCFCVSRGKSVRMVAAAGNKSRVLDLVSSMKEVLGKFIACVARI